MSKKKPGMSMLVDLLPDSEFIERHNGLDSPARSHMLGVLNVESVDGLIDQTIPDNIRLLKDMDIEAPVSEQDMLNRLRLLASENTVAKSYIGQGYYGTFVPGVIQRNVLENPGWYTAYTPYQPEIAQGRLEGLLNFQQMVMDLTGMELANASLLDEATAAAEAMALCKRAGRSKSNRFLIASDVHPQTIDVMTTRAAGYGLEVVVGDPVTELSKDEFFGVQLQYPNTYGDISDLTDLIDQVHQQNALVCVATDLLALALLKSPGELGADIAIGSAQRFGVPMGYGGPHAAFMAARDKFRRNIPGRVIGVSKDRRGKTALRMAMQTREQHIRREKATSNICTAQALLANMAAFYGIYHGPKGLKKIAGRVARLTALLAEGLKQQGIMVNESAFDTLLLKTGSRTEELYQSALATGLNLRRITTKNLGISLDETTTPADVSELLRVLTGADLDVVSLDQNLSSDSSIPASLKRTSDFLTHAVFNRYHSETEMLRYLKKLENRDLSLTHAMIPLGSCTMKLNATAEMIPVSWPEFASIHPFAPNEQTVGYRKLITQLQQMLVTITGYDAVSMQPNSGAQASMPGCWLFRVTIAAAVMTIAISV